MSGQKILVLKGILYAAGVLFLTLKAGLGITYSVYQTMNHMRADFWFPTNPFSGVAVLLLAVCIAVLLSTYHVLQKNGSLIERIRVEVE